MKENCIDCMFSENTESTIFINELTGSEHAKCKHENSPYYDELVDCDKSCRFFLNTNKYFLKKDRKDKLDNIKNNPDIFNN